MRSAIKEIEAFRCKEVVMSYDYKEGQEEGEDRPIVLQLLDEINLGPDFPAEVDVELYEDLTYQGLYLIVNNKLADFGRSEVSCEVGGGLQFVGLSKFYGKFKGLYKRNLHG